MLARAIAARVPVGREMRLPIRTLQRHLLYNSPNALSRTTRVEPGVRVVIETMPRGFYPFSRFINSVRQFRMPFGDGSPGIFIEPLRNAVIVGGVVLGTQNLHQFFNDEIFNHQPQNGSTNLSPEFRRFVNLVGDVAVLIYGFVSVYPRLMIYHAEGFLQHALLTRRGLTRVFVPFVGPYWALLDYLQGYLDHENAVSPPAPRCDQDGT